MRIIEDNLMEIEAIQGNEERVIVIEKYIVVDRDAAG